MLCFDNSNKLKICIVRSNISDLKQRYKYFSIHEQDYIAYEVNIFKLYLCHDQSFRVNFIFLEASGTGSRLGKSCTSYISCLMFYYLINYTVES